MSSKQEIKNLFVNELKTTLQYQIVLNIKNLIIELIATPNIQSTVIYNFETPQNEEDRNNINMCLIIEFGFGTNNINDNCCIIEMQKFLE